MKKILISACTMILMTLGCEKSSFQKAPSALLNTNWVLSYIQETKTNAISNYPSDAARKIFIVFSDSSNVLFFSGVCNGGRGTYSYFPRTNTVQISNIFTTQIGCRYVEWEEYTTLNLSTAFRYNINGSTLEIFSNGTYNLYFNKN